MDQDAARVTRRAGALSGLPVSRQAPPPLEPLLKAALQVAAPGIILLDPAKRVRLVTPGAAAMLGLPDRSEDACIPIMRLLARSYWLDEPALQSLGAAFKAARTNDARKVLLSLPHPAGTRILALELRPALPHGFVVLLEDVTQSEENQGWLLDQASCDPVTGLWNRQHFLLMLRDRLENGASGTTAVLLLLLKRLDQVVETGGLEAGDMLLRLVGQRLGRFLREEDVLARFPSGEFAILATGVTGQEWPAALGARMAKSLARPFMIEGQEVTIGAYIGAARTPEDGDQPEVLVANAGLALSAARAEANGQMRFFEPRLTEDARRRRQMENDLRASLVHGEMQVHFQPQMSVDPQRVIGFEALMRWQTDTRGMVSPGEFIPLAEEIGMIDELGEWVLRVACREAMRWPPDILVAVNASPLQVEAPGFAACVARALQETGLPGHRLEIEVTENLLLHDGPVVGAALRDLRALGVRLAVDDFGTGYASLSQLARFRFDRIKIDRSFVSGPGIKSHHAAIVRAIAALGLSLGVSTTAEGVETEAQLDQVRTDGCTSVQGFLFGRAMPASAIPAFLARHGQSPVHPTPTADATV